jgi:SAM-dependent methyltransferase
MKPLTKTALHCKFCNSDKVTVVRLLQSTHVNHEYTLYRCGECACMFFDVHEVSVDLAQLYESRANESYAIDENYDTFVRSPTWERQFRKINRLRRNNVSSILDVGCGTGEFLMHFPPGIDRQGVELSSMYAEVARKRGLTVHQGFVEDLHFERQYDVVTCYAVMEHLVEPLGFINKLSEMLATKGILVVMIPTYESVKRWLIDSLFQSRWHMYSPPEHLNFFSRYFLDRYLSQRGFHLADRYWSSGGMFNPFKKIALLNAAFRRAMTLVDNAVPLNKLPIFDHLYSYYIKNQ